MKLKTRFNGGGGPKSAVPSEEKGPTVSPAARNLALAHHIERLIERGIIADYTQAARMLGVSQPRMTHLMGLVLLSPTVQEAVLLGKIAPKDKELRSLARVAEWKGQDRHHDPD